MKRGEAKHGDEQCNGEAKVERIPWGCRRRRTKTAREESAALKELNNALRKKNS